MVDNKQDGLYATAEAQQGFFTARQARVSGYRDSLHPYHVRAGNWIREHRGIYRLARYPASERPDLVIWQLWSHNRQGEAQGAYSHATALALYELSDVMPRRLDMTVPHGFQRMAALPAVLRLHHDALELHEIEMVEGIRVTTPLRTLIDVVRKDELSRELQVQAVRESVRRGMVATDEFARLPLSRRLRRRLDAVLAEAL